MPLDIDPLTGAPIVTEDSPNFAIEIPAEFIEPPIQNQSMTAAQSIQFVKPTTEADPKLGITEATQDELNEVTKSDNRTTDSPDDKENLSNAAPVVTSEIVLTDVEFVEPVIHVQPTESAVINSLSEAEIERSKTAESKLTELASRQARDNADKAALLDSMNEISETYGGISNIPVNHEYWDLLKRYRGLTQGGK